MNFLTAPKLDGFKPSSFWLADVHDGEAPMAPFIEAWGAAQGFRTK